MDRRQFVTGAGSSVLGALAARADGDLRGVLQEESNDGSFGEFVDALDASLSDLGAGVVEGASVLGYGVLLLTTRADGPGDERFDEELGVVADEYLHHVHERSEAPAVGLIVEVYQRPEDVETRGDRFATYGVSTEWTEEALETGDRSTFLDRIRSSVSPPVWAADGDGEPAVELQGHELVSLDEEDVGQFEPTVGVEATVENRGNGRSGPVEATVDWYDEDGEHLGTDGTRLQTLRSGETWIGRVYPTIVDADRIDDYELLVTYDHPDGATPDGLEIEESDLHVNGEARVHGALVNESDAPLSYVEVIGRVLDGEGTVLGDDWTNGVDVGAGESWRFDLAYDDPDRARLDAIEHYEVIPLGRR